MTATGRTRTVFTTVIAGYLAVTIAESILAPLFPVIGSDLGLDVGDAGLAFGLLTGSIAAGNLLGGATLSRLGPRPGLVASLVVTGVGAAGSAAAVDGLWFVLGQAVIGLGVGIFFAPGIDTIGRAADAARRGLAMGLFGVAFSAGLAVAGALAAASAAIGWRTAFWIAAGGCVAGTAVCLFAPLPGPVSRPRRRGSVRAALTVPVVVGAIGTVSQYGTVAFMALFMVAEWGMAPAAAALVITVGRVLSVPGKLAVGLSADRWGSMPTLWALAGLLVVTGAWWTLLPGPEASVVAAIVFAAAVSALFPIANLLAVETLGDRGALLGTYRSAQIAVGALAASGMGAMAATAGLRVTLLVSSLVPAALLVVGRQRKVVPVG